MLNDKQKISNCLKKWRAWLLSRILQKVTLNMTAKRTAEMIKNNINGGENAVQ